MTPNNILPTPETSDNITSQETPESVNELDSSKAIEQKISSTTAVPSSVTTKDKSTTQTNPQSQDTASDIGSASTASVAQLDLPDVAEDIDLIEKEWVLKAKSIVRATQGDPYDQNTKLNKVKADYVKKRFNKDLNYKEE